MTSSVMVFVDQKVVRIECLEVKFLSFKYFIALEVATSVSSMKFWEQAYLRWVTYSQLIGGGTSCENMQIRRITDQLIDLDEKVRVFLPPNINSLASSSDQKSSRSTQRWRHQNEISFDGWRHHREWRHSNLIIFSFLIFVHRTEEPDHFRFVPTTGLVPFSNFLYFSRKNLQLLASSWQQVITVATPITSFCRSHLATSSVNYSTSQSRQQWRFACHHHVTNITIKKQESSLQSSAQSLTTKVSWPLKCPDLFQVTSGWLYSSSISSFNFFLILITSLWWNRFVVGRHSDDHVIRKQLYRVV